MRPFPPHHLHPRRNKGPICGLKRDFFSSPSQVPRAFPCSLWHFQSLKCSFIELCEIRFGEGIRRISHFPDGKKKKFKSYCAFPDVRKMRVWLLQLNKSSSPVVLNGGRGWWHRAGGTAWLKVYFWSLLLYFWTLLLYFWSQSCIKPQQKLRQNNSDEIKASQTMERQHFLI